MAGQNSESSGSGLQASPREELGCESGNVSTTAPRGTLIEGSLRTPQPEPQEGRCCDEEVIPMRKLPRQLTITPLNYGYNVTVGCQSFAVETPEKLVKNLEAYLKDPSGIEREWLKNGKLI